jgi:adenosylcobinamide-phosphate synthase
MTDFFSNIHAYLIDPERFTIVLMAVFLTAIIGIITGPVHGNANPLYWKVIDMLFGRIGLRLYKRQRKFSDLAFRGLILTTLVVFFSCGVGVIASDLAVRHYFYGLTQIVILSTLMTSGTVWYGLLKLFFALKEGSIGEREYYTIAQSTRTDLSSSDDHSITRTGMGYAARAFDKGLVAPAIWFIIAGFPGAFLYSGLAALSWRFGKDGFSKGFGSLPVAMEKLMGYVPMIFSGSLIAIAGLFTPTGGMTRAIMALLKQAKHAKYEEGGLPVTAMAYSLNISIGGPVQDLDGSSIHRDWIGPEGASAKLGISDLKRAIYIIFMAYLIFIVTLLSSMVYAGIG